MRQQFLVFFTFLGTYISTSAQNTFPSNGAVGIGTTAPNASSLLEMKSTSKGVLIPRMTYSQRNTIASPARGLLLFQTDGTKGFYYHDGGWKHITNGSANTTLSNLSVTTAINSHLLPNSTNAKDLGSSSLSFRDLHLRGNVYLDGYRFITSKNTPTSVFVGANGGNLTTTGEFNTAIGTQALTNIKEGKWNTVVGWKGLFNNTIGETNTAVGSEALFGNQEGNGNTAVGFQALSNVTTTFENTAIGLGAGSYATIDPSLGTFLGAFARSADFLSNVTAIGYFAYTTASNQVRIGNSSVTSIGGYAGWTNLSDGRYKKNIKEEVPGLAFINRLRPVTYTLDVTSLNNKVKAGFPGQNSSDNRKINRDLEERKAIAEKEKIVYTGFVAQEVEEAAKKVDYEFSGVDKPKNDKDFYGLRYGDFVVPLVKAVQELNKQNEEQQKQIDELKELVTKLTSSQTINTSASSSTLLQNYPNPVKGSTRISYKLPEGTNAAQLLISDASGRIVKTVQLGSSGAVNLDVSTLSSGVYNYSLIVNNKTVQTRKMTIEPKR